MATLRKTAKHRKNGAKKYWVVDYSITEDGKVRGKQELVHITPRHPFTVA